MVIAMCLGLVGCAVAVAAKPYRLTRIIGYVDPEYKVVEQFDAKLHTNLRGYMRKSLTTKDTSYQSEQSKIAVVDDFSCERPSLVLNRQQHFSIELTI